MRVSFVEIAIMSVITCTSIDVRVTVSNPTINVPENDVTVQVCATLLSLMEIRRDVIVTLATNNLEGITIYAY